MASALACAMAAIASVANFYVKHSSGKHGANTVIGQIATVEFAISVGLVALLPVLVFTPNIYVHITAWGIFAGLIASARHWLGQEFTRLELYLRTAWPYAAKRK